MTKEDPVLLAEWFEYDTASPSCLKWKKRPPHGATPHTTMTNQFPDATKMVLSPAAQAVLDALIDGRAKAAVGPQKRVTWWNDRVGLAAALRAVADEVAPETPESKQDDPDMLKGIWSERRTIRKELLAIADELEAQP